MTQTLQEMVMNRLAVGWHLLALASVLLAGCGGSSTAAVPNPVPLSADNINLVFVVSEDVAYQATGDIDPTTSNLTNRGLARSLEMSRFLRDSVLGRRNVTRIYALEPMTHLQAPGNHPDLVPAETVQQFALSNQITLSSVKPPQYIPFTGNSYPLNASYAEGYPAGWPLLHSTAKIAKVSTSKTRREIAKGRRME